MCHFDRALPIETLIRPAGPVGARQDARRRLSGTRTVRSRARPDGYGTAGHGAADEGAGGPVDVAADEPDALDPEVGTTRLRRLRRRAARRGATVVGEVGAGSTRRPGFRPRPRRRSAPSSVQPDRIPSRPLRPGLPIRRRRILRSRRCRAPGFPSAKSDRRAARGRRRGARGGVGDGWFASPAVVAARGRSARRGVVDSGPPSGVGRRPPPPPSTVRPPAAPPDSGLPFTTSMPVTSANAAGEDHRGGDDADGQPVPPWSPGRTAHSSGRRTPRAADRVRIAATAARGPPAAAIRAQPIDHTADLGRVAWIEWE